MSVDGNKPYSMTYLSGYRMYANTIKTSKEFDSDTVRKTDTSYKNAVKQSPDLLWFTKVNKSKEFGFFSWLFTRIGYAIGLVSAYDVAQLFLKYFPERTVYRPSAPRGDVRRRGQPRAQTPPAIPTQPPQTHRRTPSYGSNHRTESRPGWVPAWKL